MPGYQQVKKGSYVLEDSLSRRVVKHTDAFKACFRPGRRVFMSMLFRLRQHEESTCPSCHAVNLGLGEADVCCSFCGMQYRRITEVIEDDSKTERPSGHSSSANPKILKGAPDRDHVFVGPKTPAEADSLEDDVTQFKRVHIVAAPDVDDLSAQLGSSALLDDSDVPFSTHLSHSPPGAPVPSGFGLSRASVGTPLFPNPLSSAKYPSFSGQGNSSWATYSLFGVPFPSPWNAAAGPSWPNRPFSASGPYRTYASRRPVAIRLLIIQAIKHLSSTSSLEFAPGFYEVNLLLNQVEQLKPPNEPAIRLTEMMDICDTEGSSQNGGGSFTVEQDESGKL